MAYSLLVLPVAVVAASVNNTDAARKGLKVRHTSSVVFKAFTTSKFLPSDSSTAYILTTSVAVHLISRVSASNTGEGKFCRATGWDR